MTKIGSRGSCLKWLWLNCIQSNLSLRPPENCGHAFSVPSILGFKCTECVLENATTWEMRIADTVSAQSFDSTWEKRPNTSNWPKNTFSIVQRFPCRHSGQAIIAFASSTWHGMVVANYAPACMWELPIADGVGSCGGMCTTLLNIFEPNLANETTWEIGPLIPSPFGGRNSQVWL